MKYGKLAVFIMLSSSIGIIRCGSHSGFSGQESPGSNLDAGSEPKPLMICKISNQNNDASNAPALVTNMAKVFAQDAKNALSSFSIEDCGSAKYYHIVSKNPEKRIHLSYFNLNDPGINIRVSTPDEGERFTTPTEFASRRGMFAVINGDFWGARHQWPIGLSIGNNRKWDGTSDTLIESFFACKNHNECFFSGQDVEDHRADMGYPQVISGKPMLVENFQAKDCNNMLNYAKFPGERDLCLYHHPRSAMGRTADNHLILLAVEGRINRNGVTDNGANFPEMSKILSLAGAKEAMGLDGGGSSALVFNGYRRSARPDNEPEERRVPNLLGVHYDYSKVTISNPLDLPAGDVWLGLPSDRSQDLKVCMKNHKLAYPFLELSNVLWPSPVHGVGSGQQVCESLSNKKCQLVLDWQCNKLPCSESVESSRSVWCH